MKKLLSTIVLLTAIVITAAAQQRSVLMYGTVKETNDCGENAVAYQTKLINEDDWSSESKTMENNLKRNYPNARVTISTSKWDYSSDARCVVIISYSIHPNAGSSCYVKVNMVKFGKTYQEALSSAIKQKNEYGGSDSPHYVAFTKSW